MQTYANVMELIGNAPLLRLERLAKNSRVYAKCEFMNPLSLKDRAVLQIIEDAEADGQLELGHVNRSDEWQYRYGSGIPCGY